MSQASPYSIVVDFSGVAARNAALYFDYVVPMTTIIGPPDKFITSVVKGGELMAWRSTESAMGTEHYSIARELVPPFLDYKVKDAEAANAMMRARLEDHTVYADGRHPFGQTREERKAMFLDIWYSGIDSLLQRYPQLNASPWLWDEDGVVPMRYDGPEEFLLTIEGLELIDVSNTSWDQILEFRKDEESKKKLRRFRLFLQKSYEGKERNFIVDDLLARLDDYEATVRKWGFEKTQAVFSALFASASVTSLVVFLNVFFGTVVPASLQAMLAAAGVSATIGRLGVSLRSCRYGLSEFRRQNEMSYIIEARERLTR